MTEARPFPERIGPYRVIEILGRGGMGVVYRANHMETDEAVAVKTVAVPEPRLLQGIRREIHTLARLSHPGIVRIVAEGLQDGAPWYAMELLRGHTLDVHAREVGRVVLGSTGLSGYQLTERLRAGASRWWTQKLSRESPSEPAETSPAPAILKPAGFGDLAGMLTLVRRLCAPLAYLHGEGLVHRDVKPANVLVKPDGMPVIIDFGLLSIFAGEISRDTLEAEGEVVGTIAYLSPEQGRGQPVDARADLYALGCLLYELVTGRTPFQSPYPYETFLRRYREDPALPSELVTGVPPALDELLLRLLSRDPRERPGHAGAVALALARLGAEDGLAASGPRPRPYLYRPALSGRDALLRLIEPHLARLSGGSGGLVLLHGEGGVGKTRLANAAAARAMEMGIEVLVGDCPRDRTPLGALSRPLGSIADRCRAAGREATDRLLGGRGAILAPYASVISTLPGQDAFGSPAPLPEEAARLRLWLALAETFFEVAKDAPLLLVLDDLQDADELTMGFLDLMVRSGRLERIPVAVLGLHRSDEATDSLRSLGERAASHPVGRLDEPSMRALLGDMLAADAPDTLVLSAMSLSEGNPFVACEYLRAAVDGGLLVRDDEGRWSPVKSARLDALPLPRSVGDLLTARLARLSPSAMALLDVACAVGRECEEELLAAASGLEGQEVREAVADLLGRQVMEEPAPGVLRFSHDRLREARYGALDPSPRADLHRRVAAALESLGAWRRPELLGTLGEHWARAGESQRAREALLPAARHLASRYAAAEAERLYRLFLDLGEAPSTLDVEALGDLGDLVNRRGRPEEALAIQERALGEARALGNAVQEAESLRRLAGLHSVAGRIDLAREQSFQALTLARQAGERLIVAKTLAILGGLDQREGSIEKARIAYEEALQAARDGGDDTTLALVLGHLANLEREQGGSDAARARYHQAVEAARAAGSEADLALWLANFANLEDETGHPETAVSLYDEALALARKVGDRRLEGFVILNRAIATSGSTGAGEADPFAEALAIFRDVGDRRYEGVTLAHQTDRLAERGEIDRAAERCEQALSIAREMRDRRQECMLLDDLADLARQRGDPKRARAHADAALAIAREIGDRRDEGAVMATRATIAADAGDLDEAEALHASALAIAREVKNRWGEVINLLALAYLHRIRGSYDEAEACVEKAEPMVEELREKPALLVLACEQGHLALARGGSAAEALAKARLREAEMHLLPSSSLGQQVARLASAQVAVEAGRPLRHGQLPEDLR